MSFHSWPARGLWSKNLFSTRSAKTHKLFVTYDQLTDKIGPLSREDPRSLGIVLVENPWKAARRPHHKQKLAFILSNPATPLDVRPRELTDWFWVAYTDAYDWVVEPNVLGMGTYALGGLMTTKPYVSGAACINKMSDYCNLCPFNPKTDCPVTSLYWAFLARHEAVLKTNPRLRTPMASLSKRGKAQRHKDQGVFRALRATLLKGEVITPELL